MARKKVELGMSTMDLLLLMSEGNPGAISVMSQMMELEKKNTGEAMGAIFDILSLDDMNIRGSQIWVGYKDHCKEDIAEFVRCIKDRDGAMVDTINSCSGTGTVERAVTHRASWR